MDSSRSAISRFPIGSSLGFLGVLLLLLGLGGCVPSGEDAAPPTFSDRERLTADPVVGPLVLDRLAAAEAEVSSPEPWRDLGLVFEANGFVPEAIAAYEHAMALDPDDGRTRYHLGVCLGLAGDLESAVSRFGEAAERSPGHAPIYWRRGDAELALGRLEAAAQSYSQALAVAPGSMPARVGQVRVALARGEGAAAIERLGPMLASHEGLPILHHLMASALRLEGQLDEVATHAERAGDGQVPVWPDVWQAAVDALRQGYPERLRRGERALAEGRLAEALATFEALHTERPDDVVAASNRAAALVTVGRHDEAIGLLEPLIATASSLDQGQRFNAVMNLAAAYFLSGDLERAEPLARQARQLDPGKARPAEMLGSILLSRGDGEGALGELRTAARLDARNPNTIQRFARACEQLGAWDEAAAQYERLVGGFPQRSDLRFRWARALVEAGSLAAAREQLERLDGETLPEPLRVEVDALRQRLP